MLTQLGLSHLYMLIKSFMKTNGSGFSAWLTTWVASPARIKKTLSSMLFLLLFLGGFARSVAAQPQPRIQLPAGYTNLAFNYDSSTWDRNGGPNGGDIGLHGKPIGSSHWSVNQPDGEFWSASTWMLRDLTVTHSRLAKATFR